MIVEQKHKIKTLIIDDSGLMRIMLSDALRSDPDIEVVGTATNGKEGVEKTRLLNPDVVITDMVMPNYDGLYVVKNIMEANPKPIFLLSSLNRTNTEVFDALNAGAVDFIDKPVNNGSNSFSRSMNILTAKIKSASALNTLAVSALKPVKNNSDHTFADNLQYDMIAFGASTGGPSTLEYILGKLPTNLKVPVVIAQHMPERFIISFCQRLSEILPLKIQVAKNQEEIKPGVIYLAPGTDNLEVVSIDRPRFHLTKRKYKEFNNPSVNCLFESLATVYGSKVIATILTGMGKDGSEGLKSIKSRGGVTIAQDKDSCVVNGMPQAAIDMKVVDYTVKLNDIPGFIISCL